jgi:hypothetical protein
MGFLAPAFFAGLIAIAVPIVVHLIHRERKEVVLFPSLMFVQRIPYQAVRRQKLRHVLLFALRCLAVLLLALAFARPFLHARGAGAKVSPRQSKDVVVLLDRSFSMGYGDRWARATAAAGRAVEALGTDDRATIVTFDVDAVALNEPTGDKTLLRSAVSGATLGAAATRYDGAFKLAQRLLAVSTKPRREIVLITDFQRGGWDRRDPPRLPAGTTITRVDLSDKTTSNVAVTGIDFRRDAVGGRERVAVQARVINRSAAPLPDYAVALEINGRPLETKHVKLDANAAASVTFTPTPVPEGAARVVVRGAADALPRDNVFHAVLARGQTLPVVLVESPDAAAGHSLFIQRALGIGDRPAFRIDVRRAGELTVKDLDTHALVIVNDANPPGGEAERHLVEFVKRGGGLVVVLGDHTSPRSWPTYADELLPRPDGDAIDRLADRGGTLGVLDRSHPVFEPFTAPRSGDFSTARFFRYRGVTAGPTDAQIARFDDGRVALLERRVGQGRVLLWTSSLDGVWNDLPLQPVFLPFLQQVAKHAASYREDRPWSIVGQVIDPAVLFGDRVPNDSGRPARSVDAQCIATTPAGRRVRLSGTAGATGVIAAAGSPTLQLVETGFYELQRKAASGDAVRQIAVNVDVTESDLTALDPELFATAMLARTGTDTTAADAALTAKDLESAQSLWWYVLAATVLLLGAESLLANRLSRTVR